MNQFRTIVFAAFGCAALIIASCKKSSGTSANTGKPVASVQTEGVSCDIVSTDEVGATLGITDLIAPKSQWDSSTKIRTCNYSQNNNPSGVIITYRTVVGRSLFDQTRHMIDSIYKKLATQDIAGIGDAAYAVTDTMRAGNRPILMIQIHVLKGSLWFSMVTTMSTLEKEKQLAGIIISRL